MSYFKAFLGLAVLAAIVYCAFVFMPPYLNYYQFSDELENQSRFNSVGSRSEEDIKADVMKKAREFGIPVQPDDVKVRRIAGMGSSEVVIWADYNVYVDTPVETVVLHFHPASSNKERLLRGTE